MPSARRATWWHSVRWSWSGDFYPRPPRGGRLVDDGHLEALEGFLSTPSARRATRAFHSTVPGLRYFYPRPPRGGRQSCPHSRLQRLGISIHALREEGDLHPGDVDWPPVISIHALREEGDISSSAVFSAMGVFLSTPSARRATPEWRGMLRSGCNFYPRPPRGGRRRGVWLFSTCPHISIHALREEGDVCAIYDISELISFLSTPSARRATCCGPRGGDSGCYFYPRPPRGGRPKPSTASTASCNFYPRPPRGGRLCVVQAMLTSSSISIHALREEGDQASFWRSFFFTGFLSTPSARRATGCATLESRAETYFYPRPPRGGRRGDLDLFAELVTFLSTPSARRATGPSASLLSKHQISIHALREEGDEQRHCSWRSEDYFYPRPPRGGRQQKQRQNLYFQTNYTTFCTNLEEP